MILNFSYNQLTFFTVYFVKIKMLKVSSELHTGLNCLTLNCMTTSVNGHSHSHGCEVSPHSIICSPSHLFTFSVLLHLELCLTLILRSKALKSVDNSMIECTQHLTVNEQLKACLHNDPHQRWRGGTVLCTTGETQMC